MRGERGSSAGGGPVAFVTGATGAVGPVLVWYLHEQGYRVRILTRDAACLAALPPALDVIVGEITDSAALQRGIEGAEFVFHLAARLHINHPKPELCTEYERVNVEGTSRLVETAAGMGVVRLVFFSTVCTYGPCQPGQVLDERAPLRPQTLYARTKCQAEKTVLAARRGRTAEPLGVVLRLATVYGARMKGNYVRLVRALHKGWFVPVGRGENRRTLVCDRDAARAALLAAEQRQAAGKIYNVTDGSVHTFEQIVIAICRALGRKPPGYCLPAPPVRAVAGLVEDSLSLVGMRSPVGRWTVDKLLEDMAISGTKIQRELGFRPRVDLATGWREVVENIVGGRAEPCSSG